MESGIHLPTDAHPRIRRMTGLGRLGRLGASARAGLGAASVLVVVSALVLVSALVPATASASPAAPTPPAPTSPAAPTSPTPASPASPQVSSGPGGSAQPAVTSASTSSQNLLLGDAAAFDGTTGGWTSSGAALSWAATPSVTPAGSLEMTADTTSWVVASSPTPPAAGAVPASAGAKFAGSAEVEVDGTPGLLSDFIGFYNSSGSMITAVWGQTVTPTLSGWTQLPEVAGIAPSSTHWVALGVIAWTASLGQHIYVAAPVLNAIGSSTAPVVGPLHTAGDQIVQANGQPVALHGVVLDGLEATPTSIGSGVTEQAVIEAKAWGANFVRVPLGEQFWLSSNCEYAPGYEATVDQVVKWITSLGMVALLDLHFNTVGGCEVGAQHNMADEAQAPTFWSEVASRYGNPSSAEYSPLVAFDLYNEPHNISNSIWLNGGETTDIYAPYQTYEAAGMQQLYDVVRSAGSQNLVFISGNNWANDPPSQLVSGDNIVYAVHYYTCPSVAPPSCTNSNPYNSSQDLDQWIGFSATQPIVVTEFGWPSESSGSYLSNVITFAESEGWGWSSFAFQQQNGGTWDLADWLPDGTAEPNPSGIPVLLGLSGVG
jgi:aryl-phospho-beta-D-glucosidase BglC (GH1 family)